MPLSEHNRLPNRLTGRVAEWQAGRIEDPLEKLRYLRRTVGDQRVWTPDALPARSFWQRHRVRAGVALAAVVLLPAGRWAGAIMPWSRPVAAASPVAAAPDRMPNVWLIEQKDGFESYSNGLRIETKYTVENGPRRYRAFPLGQEEPGRGEERTWPAGIVFHTTESHLVSFAPDKTIELKQFGESLLKYVQGERAYHYVIDRFGRVWRIVKETDSANHAGHSVWADDKSTYVNLNQSFVGISLEAQTRGDSGRPSANRAQVDALRALTEMVRSKYRIAARNCVAHAQVSVNPSNGQLSYHTDWALGFPFVEIGLPDNYTQPSPAMWLFGFTYDVSLVNLSGSPFWKGLLLGEDQLRQRATAHGAAAGAYRKNLWERYRRVLTSVKAANGTKNSETTGNSEETREKQG
jgi:hypothetical protein